MLQIITLLPCANSLIGTQIEEKKSNTDYRILLLSVLNLDLTVLCGFTEISTGMLER